MRSEEDFLSSLATKSLAALQLLGRRLTGPGKWAIVLAPDGTAAMTDHATRASMVGHSLATTPLSTVSRSKEGVRHASSTTLPTLDNPKHLADWLSDSEYCLVRSQAAIRVPEGIDAASHAPVICAGVTTFNALSMSGLEAGDTVAIQGLGGLGHMAIQFASKMGFRVVAISRGPGKEADARKLGAHKYIDASLGDVGAALRKLGGAKVALTTALSSEAMTPLIKGLNILGRLIILALPGDVTINTYEMCKYGISVQVCPTGNASDSEKAFDFAARHNVCSIVETFPLDKAQEAFGM